MNGIILIQGMNTKTAQVEFNDSSTLMQRQIQIKLPSPGVIHNGTQQAKDITWANSKITTNIAGSCDFADIKAQMSSSTRGQARAQVDKCIVYQKKYPSIGIPCIAVRVFGSKKLFSVNV